MRKEMNIEQLLQTVFTSTFLKNPKIESLLVSSKNQGLMSKTEIELFLGDLYLDIIYNFLEKTDIWDIDEFIKKNNKTVEDISNLFGEQFLDELIIAINESINEIINFLSDKLLKDWIKYKNRILGNNRKNIKFFIKKNMVEWKNPMDDLNALIQICFQTGGDFLENNTETFYQNEVFISLTGLHARGCQVASEAFLLLQNGYADGASARWRTLHEICVVAEFISKKGDKTARKFLDYSSINELKVATSFDEYKDKIDYQSVESDYLSDLKLRRKELIDKYGDNFIKNYGWAKENNKNNKLSLFHLEKAVGLNFMRPFYLMANTNIHADSSSIYFRYGYPENGRKILLAGPSIYGMIEPGRNLAYSIYLLTHTLLSFNINFENVGTLFALEKLQNKVFEEFSLIDERNF